MADRVDISAVARVVDQTSGPIRAIEGAIGKAARAAKTAASSFVRLGSAGAFGGLAANMRNVGAAAGRLGGQLRGLVTRVGAIAGIAGIAGIGGVVASIKSYISTASGLVSTSRRLGVSAENLQKFHFAAEQTGLSAEGLESGLSKFQKSLAGLARGGKDTANMIPLLRKFGITLADIKAGDIAAMLPKIATGFQKNTNELTRNAMATALFGKSGAALINFLSQGGEEMAKLGAEAVKLGIITNREAEDANTAGDQWQKFQRAMTAVRNTLAAELLPVIQPVVLALTKWIAANRDWLRTKIHDAVIALSAGVRQLRDAVLWVVGAMGGWRNTLIALGLLINAKLIGSLLGLGLAIGKLALSALALNPLTLAIAGLAAGAYLVYRNWGTIGPWFERQMNAVKGVFEQSGAAVRDWARTSAASIKTAFETGGTMAGITAIGEALKTAFSGVFQYIRDGLVNIDWAVLGDQIRNIDWAAIGYATSQAIVAAFKAGLNLVEWLAELDWEAVGAAAGRLLVLGIAGTFKAMFEIGKWLIGLDWGAITLAIVGFFDSLVRTFFDIGARLLKGLIDGMIDAIPGLRRVTDAVSAAFSLPGQLGQRLFGAGPAAAPATAGGPNLLQQSAAAAPAQRSEIEQRLKVDLAPELRASLTSERTSGAPVRSEVEIGRSMAPAWGAA